MSDRLENARIARDGLLKEMQAFKDAVPCPDSQKDLQGWIDSVVAQNQASQSSGFHIKQITRSYYEEELGMEFVAACEVFGSIEQEEMKEAHQ